MGRGGGFRPRGDRLLAPRSRERRRVLQRWEVHGSKRALSVFPGLLCPEAVASLEDVHVLRSGPRCRWTVAVWGRLDQGPSPGPAHPLHLLARAPFLSWTVVGAAGIRFRALAPDRDAFCGFLDRLRGSLVEGFEVEVCRVGGLEPDGDPPEEELAPGERRCLEAALDLGYYEIPRRCGVREIGESLGVSKSLVSQRLRRLERGGVRRLYAQGAPAGPETARGE